MFIAAKKIVQHKLKQLIIIHLYLNSYSFCGLNKACGRIDSVTNASPKLLVTVLLLLVFSVISLGKSEGRFWQTDKIGP
jgi:hypothetical protein